MACTIYNFSAGPAVLPRAVLEQARAELLSLEGSGMSVMEISHRSERFHRILDGARQGIRDLLAVPDGYEILFMQGGASLQFSMIPMNFLRSGRSADYLITGSWGEKALKEARRRGKARIAYTSAADGYRKVPKAGELWFADDVDYVHYTSNETIEGVEFDYDLEAGLIPVICDASSNILSKPIDIEKYALIYAGAQKNIGPSGLSLIIIREDMLARAPDDQFAMLDYRNFARAGSMPNTPNTWAIYIAGLVCEWVKKQGGVAELARRNREKADLLYKAIDSSDGFYTGHAERDSRSLMNVTFRLPSVELDEKFCSEAATEGLDGLRGHRVFGGIRASIYNAFPREGVERLCEFMSEFAACNG